VDDLQKTLLQLKLLSEKRELVQQQIQQKLEQEVQQLKEHKVGAPPSRGSHVFNFMLLKSESPLSCRFHEQVQYVNKMIK